MWHSYVIHVKFSDDPAVSFQDVTRDGQVVVPKTRLAQANMNTPRAYLKIGMYRDADASGTTVVCFDDLTISTG